jgi:hypothetical protein
MSGDVLCYDMASASEGSPKVFVRKDYLSILDNQSQNYSSNQSVIDTSQLSNSNKYMNYREGYLVIPLLLTLTAPANTTNLFTPATAGQSADFVMGLRNWLGTIIHSFTVDMNGTTIIAQTPYLPMWNTFKLMTTLSLNDIKTQGSSIGFFPDDAMSVAFTTTSSGTPNTSQSGTGTNNNVNAITSPVVSGAFNSYLSGNEGFMRRQMYYNLNPDGATSTAINQANWSSLISTAYLTQSYKSYIFNKINATASLPGVFQQAITGVVYLKHIHSFFNEIPLVKGTFFKITMFLSNTSVQFTTSTASSVLNLGATSVTNPLGGVQPLMIASALGSSGSSTLPSGVTFTATLSVGSRCLNTQQASLAGVLASPLSTSITLNVPAYTFSPTYEQAYLSEPIKKIIYEDLYQYQYLNVAPGGYINFLATNGIANLQKVLVLPYFTAASNGGLDPYVSPYEPTGAGPTSPLCILGNFNVVVSGQNSIYNSERFTYEQFVNQLYGINSVNGGLTDGLTSSLIGQIDFETSYNYYVVNVGRMLPVEEAVPKSVSVIGQNLSGQSINLYVFLSYGVQVDIDILTGSRVG